MSKRLSFKTYKFHLKTLNKTIKNLNILFVQINSIIASLPKKIKKTHQRQVQLQVIFLNNDSIFQIDYKVSIKTEGLIIQIKMKDGKKLVKKCLEKQKACNFYSKIRQKHDDFAKQSKHTNDSARKSITNQIGQKSNNQKGMRSNPSKKNTSRNFQTDHHHKKEIKHLLSDNNGTVNQNRRFKNYEELIKSYQKNHDYQDQELKQSKLKQCKSEQSLGTKMNKQRELSLKILQKLRNESGLELKYLLHKKRNHEKNRASQILPNQQKTVAYKFNDPTRVKVTDKMRLYQTQNKNAVRIDDPSFKPTQVSNVAKELLQKERQMEKMYMQLQQKYKQILKSTKYDIQKYEENKILLQRLKSQHFQHQSQLEELTSLITHCQSTQLNTQAESYQSLQQSRRVLKNFKYTYGKISSYNKNITKIPVSTQTQTLKADFEQIKRKYLNYEIQHEANGQMAPSFHKHNQKQSFESERQSNQFQHTDPLAQIKEYSRIKDTKEKAKSNKLDGSSHFSKQISRRSHQYEFMKPPSYPQLLIKNSQKQKQSSFENIFSQNNSIHSKPKHQPDRNNQKLNHSVSNNQEQSSPAFKSSGSHYKQQMKKSRDAFRPSSCKLDPKEVNPQQQQSRAQFKSSHQASVKKMDKSIEKANSVSEKDMIALKRDLFGCKSTEMVSKNNQTGATNKQFLDRFRKQYKNQLQQSKIACSYTNDFRSSNHKEMKQTKNHCVCDENGLDSSENQSKREATQQHRFQRNKKLNKLKLQTEQMKEVQSVASRKYSEKQKKEDPCEYAKINASFKKNGKNKANEGKRYEENGNREENGIQQEQRIVRLRQQIDKETPQTPINKFYQRKPISPSSQLNKYRFKPSLKFP